MQLFHKRWLLVLWVGLASVSLGFMGCDKLKKLTQTKPKVIKGPKFVIKITKLSKAVRIVGGHKALMKKALKKVSGYRDSSIDWSKKLITVGHKEDADSDKFVESLREYGYGAQLQDSDDD